jgi:predicted ABC-type ATPase
MKTKSESYQDYKVIKEGVMDGVWKIGADSLSKREQQLADAKSKIKSLQNEVATTRTELKAKEDSMADVVFASTHIQVLGIAFSKGFFLVLISLGIAGLIATLLLLLARIKSMHAFVKESKVIVASVTNEFEEYKRKSFEKQTKLNRELQTERNKLIELQEARKAG